MLQLQRYRVPVMLMMAALMAMTTFAQDASKIRRFDTKFDHVQTRFFFFRDSANVLLHESMSNDVWRSTDEGQAWSKASTIPQSATRALIQHPFSAKEAFAITDAVTHYKTVDSGASWTAFTTPSKPASANSGALSFHSQRPGYLIFMGTLCSGGNNRDCYNAAYYSTDMGSSWKLLNTYVQQCFWGSPTDQIKSLPADSVYCTEYTDKTGEQKYKQSGQLTLAYSENFFIARRTVTFDNSQTDGIVGFGAVNKFLVTAVKPKNSQDLDMYVSVDGWHFSNAQFPLGSNLRENVC